jgi:hypothetical protein
VECPCRIRTISSHHYLFECTNLTPERDKLHQATTYDFTLQLLFKDEKGIMALIKFARNTSLGYCKIVQCRTTPLENDKERMDMGIAALGFVAFDG